MRTHFLLAGEVKNPEDLEFADFLLTNHPESRGSSTCFWVRKAGGGSWSKPRFLYNNQPPVPVPGAIHARCAEHGRQAAAGSGEIADSKRTVLDLDRTSR